MLKIVLSFTFLLWLISLVVVKVDMIDARCHCVCVIGNYWTK